MQRRRRREGRVNHERWLVSYADFITLLFAFFVVMFAVSRVDSQKVGTFQTAVQEATSIGIFDHHGTSPILDGSGPALVRPAPTADAQPAPAPAPSLRAVISAQLRNSLTAAISAGRVSLVDGRDGLVIRLGEAAFFESASATLREEVISDLDAIGRTLRDVPNDVRIEGHTDAVPIRSSHFRSNWELSAARAAEVLALFTSRSGVEEQRMSVAGYGSYRPLLSNDSDEGRAANRRVDVVVLDPAPRLAGDTGLEAGGSVREQSLEAGDPAREQKNDAERAPAAP